MKNNLIIDIEEHLVRYFSGTWAGRIHDKRICDAEDYTFPPGCVLFKDTGFQGFEPANVSTYQPKKKPRNQELRAEDKTENQMISSIRILVELTFRTLFSGSMMVFEACAQAKRGMVL